MIEKRWFAGQKLAVRSATLGNWQERGFQHVFCNQKGDVYSFQLFSTNYPKTENPSTPSAQQALQSPLICRGVTQLRTSAAQQRGHERMGFCRGFGFRDSTVIQPGWSGSTPNLGNLMKPRNCYWMGKMMDNHLEYMKYLIIKHLTKVCSKISRFNKSTYPKIFRLSFSFFGR